MASACRHPSKHTHTHTHTALEHTRGSNRQAKPCSRHLILALCVRALYRLKVPFPHFYSDWCEIPNPQS